MAITIQSPAFAPGGTIPAKHTYDGPNLSPPLRWSDPPPRTRSFTLIVDDPDAPVGTWVHWVLYSIPATLRALPGGVPPQPAVAGVGVQGMNDFKKLGWGGPSPPRGAAHRYFFRLYALDIDGWPTPRMTRPQLVNAMQGHVLAQGELMGRYQRK